MPRSLIIGLALALVATIGCGQTTRLDKPALDFEALRSIPVLEGTRYKPLDSLAREWVERITGKDPYQKQESILHLLHWVFEPEVARTRAYLKLPDADATRAIGLEPSKDRTHVSFDDLFFSKAWAEAWANAQARDEAARSTTDSEVLRLAQRYGIFARFAAIRPGEQTDSRSAYLPLVPPPPPHRMDAPAPFRTLAEAEEAGWKAAQLADTRASFAALGASFRSGDIEGFSSAGQALAKALAALGYPSSQESTFRGSEFMAREVKYNAGRFFYRSFWIYFSAFLVGLLAVGFSSFPKLSLGLRWICILMTMGALAYHAYGVFERTTLSQRAMIGTFYESMVFVAGVCALAGLIFECIVKNGWFVLVGALGASLALYVATHNPEFMQPAISNLQAVLDNNDWIHIHVPTIMTGYAVLAVAILLSHVYLIRSLWMNDGHPAQLALARTMFWTVPVGEIVLVAGIILGGVWADASWGRFWGFDPKEVGALILFLVFMVVIHGRWAGWLRDFGTAVGGWVGSLALFWSYYGTNFFWTGKHSYAEAGGSRDIPTWMYAYLGTEVVILGLVLLKRYGSGGTRRVA